MDVIAGKEAPEVIDYLLRRRSVMADKLSSPGPDANQLAAILSAASRVPDHGKLTPFYFLVFSGDARKEAGDLIAKAFAQANPDAREDKVEIERARFMRAPLVVGVVSRIRKGKPPMWEQVLCAGAASQNLVLAANAHGFAAQWLTEWYAYDENVRQGLGLDERDTLAGFIYIGTPTEKPEERDRPELSRIVNHWTTGMTLAKGDEYDREKFGMPVKGFALLD